MRVKNQVLWGIDCQEAPSPTRKINFSLPNSDPPFMLTAPRIPSATKRLMTPHSVRFIAQGPGESPKFNREHANG